MSTLSRYAPGRIFWLDEKPGRLPTIPQIKWNSGTELMALRQLGMGNYQPSPTVRKSLVVQLRSAWNRWRGVEVR